MKKLRARVAVLEADLLLFIARTRKDVDLLRLDNQITIARVGQLQDVIDALVARCPPLDPVPGKSVPPK